MTNAAGRRILSQPTGEDHLMVHIESLLIALKVKFETGDHHGRVTAKECLEFLEHAQNLARKAKPEVTTASAAKELIDLLLPNDGTLR